MITTEMQYTDEAALQAQVNEVLRWSQGEPDPQTDELFVRWKAAKQRFIDLFGGLIYTVPEPVSFRLGEKEKVTRFNDFIDEVLSVYGNRDLAYFLAENAAGFYDNKTIKTSVAPDDTVVQEGTKIVRAFKHFESNPNALEKLQTRASMIIQDDKISGTLCFSVHPLDYLSSSENNYNWRSCHSLDGEYRCGNLSYMCDNVTIVCYLRGDRDEKLPRFPETVPWNSKKWRMLLTINESKSIMFAGRQYPFISDGALDIISPHLFRALKLDSFYWTTWHDDFISGYSYKNGMDSDSMLKHFPIGARFFVDSQIIKNGVSGTHNTQLHFNDLLSSSCYTPFYCWNKFMWFGRLTNDMKITVGAEAPCIHCGKKGITTTDSMYCEDCEGQFGHSEDERWANCDCCDGRFERDEGVYLVDGSFVCQGCAEYHCEPCQHCGMLMYSDDRYYHEASGETLCRYCYEERTERE